MAGPISFACSSAREPLPLARLAERAPSSTKESRSHARKLLASWTRLEGGVPLRQGPSAAAAIIGQIPYATELELLSKRRPAAGAERWAKVTFGATSFAACARGRACGS